MEHASQTSALTVALALAAGVLSQIVARHLSIPGIVVLLATGVLLGPEVAGVVQPASLGPALHTLVGFAVAVILFEGAMSLNLRRLRQEARVIQRLVLLGGLITAAGGAVAARWLMGWDWRASLLFGTLVMVTGPTVVTPLLRRIRVTRNLHTVLEAEGVFIDAVGAVLAVVALEAALEPAGSRVATGVTGLGLRWAVGLALGFSTGALLALGLKAHRLVPEGLSNVFTLALVLALFQGSNTLAPESGIIAVIAAGLLVGNSRSPVQRDLLEFKEQLTVMLVGMLFVLLAADVRVDEVLALGWPGLATVAVLMGLVRPLAVGLATWGSKLTRRERAFMAWLGPRGIVAAAVASLFAQRLDEAGMGGGHAMRALVFLVIAVTVVVQGLSGGVVAGWLGVRRAADGGYVLLGANALARSVGRVLREAGTPVVLVDASAEACRAAEEDGFKVLYGSGLEERTLQRTEPESREGYVGLTRNEGVNLLFARRAREQFKVPRVAVAVHRGRIGVSTGNVEELGGGTLFGAPQNLDLWVGRYERKEVRVERWRRAPEAPAGPGSPEASEDPVLPLVLLRGGKAQPYDSRVQLRPGDEVAWAVVSERAAQAHAWLEAHGWVTVQAEEPPPAGAS